MIIQARTENSEMFIAMYETEEPKPENYSEMDIELFSAYDIDHKEWQSYKREYRVAEKDKEAIKIAIISTELWVPKFAGGFEKQFNEALEKGIDCTFLKDRLELVKPESGCQFEPFWTLKPHQVEEGDKTERLINEYFDGLIKIDKDLQSKDKSQLVYDLSVANINQLNMIREMVIQIIKKR